MRDLGDLVVIALVWNIWFARNDHIFNVNVLHAHVIIFKIDRILLSWFSSVTKESQAKLEDSMAIIQNSLEVPQTSS